MSLKIIGAGMAGLIAAGMLRRYEPKVLEAKESLPDNHGALLRFRSPVVAEAVGQTFREVEVTKAWKGVYDIWAGNPPISISNQYSFKVTGQVLPRSIMNLDPVTRWIAPDDFVSSLSKGVSVTLNSPVDWDLLQSFVAEGYPIISTIPMPVLMGMVKWDPMPRFTRREIWSIRARITSTPVNVHQTIYYPLTKHIPYRASITGDLLIIEVMCRNPNEIKEDLVESAIADFGILDCWYDDVEVVHQTYGKLLPIPEEERRAFILAMTDKYGIYSLGRFGTWRQILLDDLVNDIRVIDRLISGKDSYSRHLSTKGK